MLKINRNVHRWNMFWMLEFHSIETVIDKRTCLPFNFCINTFLLQFEENQTFILLDLLFYLRVILNDFSFD